MLIIIIRSVFVYLLIIISLRLTGKKQLGELQPSELVTTILISNIATLSLEDTSIPMIMGIIPIFMIVSLDVIMSAVTLKNRHIRKLVAGSPRVIISNGIINQVELKSLRFTLDDIIEAAREQQIFDIATIQYAIVETTGKINFCLKTETQKNPPSIVVSNGIICKQGLVDCGKTANWVESILKKEKIALIDVFLVSADSDGNYDVIKNDHIKGKLPTKEAL